MVAREVVRKNAKSPWQFKVCGITGCWVWQRSVNEKGYSAIQCPLGVSGHRVYYRHLVGKIPSTLTVDHLCRNRSCVNPAHLEIVRVAENVLRGNGVTANNARRVVCMHGHPLKGQNLITGRRLTPSGQWAIVRNCRICTYESNKQEKRIKSMIRRELARATLEQKEIR